MFCQNGTLKDIKTLRYNLVSQSVSSVCCVFEKPDTKLDMLISGSATTYPSNSECDVTQETPPYGHPAHLAAATARVVKMLAV